MLNRFFYFILFLFICFLFPLVATAQTVDIPDPNLRAAIETAIGKASGASITSADMATVTYLEALNANIHDLTGLEYATNLIYLFLWNNSISDLSSLSGLTKLEFLDLQGNPVSDLSPLVGLTNLIFLGLTDNPLSDSSIQTDISTLQDRGIEVFTGSRTPTTGQGNSGNNQQGTNPSSVAMDRVIFNEIRNAPDDKNDWIELKNISDEPVSLIDWEISIVIPSEIKMAFDPENAGKDIDVVTFPDYTLPTGGILLIMKTHPSNTDLIRGRDITNPDGNPDMLPQQLIAPDMVLPNTPYLLILRSAPHKNGKPEAFEDVLGNYFRGFAGYTLDLVGYSTQMWPLSHTRRPPNRKEAALTQGQAWQRIAVNRRGYFAEAWASSGYHAGLGYKPKASPETSLGTPGYPSTSDMNEVGTGQISFSEVMFATTGGLFSLSQWIELYNNSPTDVVNLKGWKLVIEAWDSETERRYTTLTLNTLEIMPNQTVLLATRNHRDSGHLPERRVYDLYYHHSASLKLRLYENRVIGSEGFGLQLFSPDGTLVDIAGNLNGNRDRDAPSWKLPQGITEAGTRTSLIRRYTSRGFPLLGTDASSWVRAADTVLVVHAWWGNPTDYGTPGYVPGSPLPVVLSHLSAERLESGVVMKWSTESEMDNAGFNILRGQTREGPFVRVNPTLIPGAGTTSERHDYEWIDTTAVPNIMYYYQIEDVSFSGDRQGLATVRMKGHVSASGKLLQKWGDVKRKE